MKNIKKITKETDVVISLTCDCCHKTFDDELEMQEFLEIDRLGGYDSIFGDGNRIEVDICQYCLKIMLKDIDVRIEARNIPKGLVLCKPCFGTGLVDGNKCVSCDGIGLAK